MLFRIPTIHALILVVFLILSVNMQAEQLKFSHDRFFPHYFQLCIYETLGSSTLHFGLKYVIIYQLDAIEYLIVFFQLDMFRAYTPLFRSNGCYSFFTYAAYGFLGVVRCRS